MDRSRERETCGERVLQCLPVHPVTNEGITPSQQDSLFTGQGSDFFFLAPLCRWEGKPMSVVDCRGIGLGDTSDADDIDRLVVAADDAETASPPWQRLLRDELKLTMGAQIVSSTPSSIVKLDLGGNNLRCLPMCLERLTCLEILFLTGNRFEVLPSVLRRLESVTRLSLRQNRLREVDFLNLPPKLVHVIFTENEIARVTNLRNMTPIRKLMLSGNRIVSLSRDVFGVTTACSQEEKMTTGNTDLACMQLQLLRLARNRIASLDAADTAILERLPCLAWISFSGNPISNLVPTGVDAMAASRTRKMKNVSRQISSTVVPAANVVLLPDPAAPRISLREIIGEGASSRVLACNVEWVHDGCEAVGVGGDDVVTTTTSSSSSSSAAAAALRLPAALKVFKAVSSDGNGDDEYAVLDALPFPHVGLGGALGFAVVSPCADGVVVTDESIDVARGDLKCTAPRPDGLSPLVKCPVYIRVLGTNLARPPTIDTVADDIIDPMFTWGQRRPQVEEEHGRVPLFAWEDARVVALATTGAVRDMHRVGLVHGDIYLHNTYYAPWSPARVTLRRQGSSPSPAAAASILAWANQVLEQVSGLPWQRCRPTDDTQPPPPPGDEGAGLFRTPEEETMCWTLAPSGNVNRCVPMLADFGASFFCDGVGPAASASSTASSSSVGTVLQRIELRALGVLMRDLVILATAVQERPGSQTQPIPQALLRLADDWGSKRPSTETTIEAAIARLESLGE